MLGKLSCLLVLCQIIAFTHGGVLRTTDDDAICTRMYVNCTTNEECCGFLRCLDFGNGNQCRYGTDNPQIKELAGQAIQPPLDLLKDLGCGLLSQTCEKQDCCVPYVCTSNGTCKKPDVSPFGFGNYAAGYPGK